MMGVYFIKDMEMPARCVECRLSTLYSTKERPLCRLLMKYMTYEEWKAKRLDNCPLIEVPEPHGRLIDADALKVSLVYAKETAKWLVPLLRTVLIIVDKMPTIIPASEEGE